MTIRAGRGSVLVTKFSSLSDFLFLPVHVRAGRAERSPGFRRAHHAVALRLSWRFHSTCSCFAAKAGCRPRYNANPFYRLFQKHCLQTRSTEPVVFDATGTFAVPARVLEGHIEHENTSVTQVVERLCALWIGAMTYHVSSPCAGRRLLPGTIAVSLLPGKHGRRSAGPKGWSSVQFHPALRRLAGAPFG
jgi:hypothetical protein